MQAAKIRQVGSIPLHNPSEVVVQPLVATPARGTRQRLRIATSHSKPEIVGAAQPTFVAKEGLTIDQPVDELLTVPREFTLAEAVQFDRLRPTGQAVLGRRQPEQISGSGEQEASRSEISIDHEFERQDHLRNS